MNIQDVIHKDPVAAALYVLRVFLLLIILCLLLLSTGCASTVRTDGMNEDGSMTYTLTPEQVAQCAREGGCSTVTSAYEQELVRQAAKHFCGVDI